MGTHNPASSRRRSHAPGDDDGLFADVPERREGLELVFTLLAVTIDHDTVALAYRALGSGDPKLRGTALEYLEAVLPDGLQRALFPFLGERPSAAGGLVARARSRDEIAGDLLRSRANVALSLAQLRKRR